MPGRAATRRIGGPRTGQKDFFKGWDLPTQAPRPEAREPELFFCAVCNAQASFGYGVHLLRGKPGTWYCAEHRHVGEATLRERE